MKTFLACTLSLLLLGTAPAFAGEDGRQEDLRFRAGKAVARVTGRIQGRRYVDYRVYTGAGRRMTVDFRPTGRMAYFNVLPPGSEEALFVGSTSGNRFEGALPSDGIYTIRVYLVRAAARRNESSRYTLEVRMEEGDAPSPAGRAFDRKLSLQGIRFRVTCPNAGSLNTVRIAPFGLEVDNRPVEQAVDGTVTGAEVADLDADGSPEVYVYAASAGSGSYGSLVAYAANRRRSLSGIHLPPLAEDRERSKGYMGHDGFAVGEGALLRRFPVYREGDANASPTGGTRQLQYRLVPGEAGWLLKVDRVVEY